MAYVCVFCSGKPDVEPVYLDLAGEAGRVIGARGHGLVYGGGGHGMMGSLAVAARHAGAPVVGVTTQGLVAAEQAGEVGGDLIVAPSLAERKAAMIDKADAFLVLPGGLGTLDELFEVWTTGPQLRLHTKPIVLVNSGGFYSGLLAWLREACDQSLLHAGLLTAITVAKTVDDALDSIAGFLAHQ